MPFNTTFYKSPIVILSVNHEYNLKVKGSRPPENNIISAWLEVSLPFYSNLRKQPARHFARRHVPLVFPQNEENPENAITGFPVKRRLWNDCRNSILMTCTYQIKIVLLIGHAAREIFCMPRSAYIVTHHQCAISAHVPQIRRLFTEKPVIAS